MYIRLSNQSNGFWERNVNKEDKYAVDNGFYHGDTIS